MLSAVGLPRGASFAGHLPNRNRNRHIPWGIIHVMS